REGRHNQMLFSPMSVITEAEVLELVTKLAVALASEGMLEDVDAEVAAQSAALAVAEAEIARARAALQAAELRLGYTRISADWSEAGGARVVGERLVDAGDTVAANTPLLSVLATDALKAVIQVPQAVFGSLEIGQGAAIHAPALAGRSVDAEVVRIAPRFDPASRQARVELRVPNADGALAPGMYVQVALRARSVEASAIVPVRALVERGGQRGVFTVDGERARFVPVEVLLEAGGEAALVPEGPAPRSVVVLGQDQLRDGAGVMPSGADAS
ncbi:efflux RND transporter periplasmic adaptor subunit, partial [Algiphilus sp.]|uniref:efflux RND transporter periplasmic adaptor subunit n=1 Tax=Algiphilus sp. TaxID=1872431 RepID=UPI003C63B836